MDDEKIKNISQVAIRKLSPNSGDIMVVKFPDDVNHEHIKGFAENFVKCLPEKVSVLFVNSDMTLEHIPEVEMNKLGWYKFDNNKMN